MMMTNINFCQFDDIVHFCVIMKVLREKGIDSRLLAVCSLNRLHGVNHCILWLHQWHWALQSTFHGSMPLIRSDKRLWYCSCLLLYYIIWLWVNYCELYKLLLRRKLMYWECLLIAILGAVFRRIEFFQILLFTVDSKSNWVVFLD